MKNKINKNNRKRLILYWNIFFFLFLISTGYFLFGLFAKTGNTSKNQAFKEISKELETKKELIGFFLNEVESNVLFLSELPSLKNLVNSDNPELKEQFKSRLQEDFLELANKNKGVYHNLRYIDETGQEIVKIDFHHMGHPKIIEGNELQNKNHRYYFGETLKLDKGEVFISPVDLNTEQGKLENRGTQENPEYVSVIRYSAPVFDNNGNLKGLVITNIHAHLFLDEVRKNWSVDNGEVFLINGKGDYLSHLDSDKEFEFMFDKKSSFFEDYPEEITQKILANAGQTFTETNEFVVSWRYIYPFFLDIKDSEEIKGINFQNIPPENHFWVLGIVKEKGGKT